MAASTSPSIGAATMITFASARFATWAISVRANRTEVGRETAPILMMAKLHTMIGAMLGIRIRTRSPSSTPSFFSPLATRFTLAWSCL